MSGVWQEVWSSQLCKRCLANGLEKHLKYVITDEQELSMLQLRCMECRAVETIASALGNDVRKQLLKAQKRAKTRALTLVTIGALIPLGAIVIAASALAALK
jgi:hypothetical protein